MNDGIKQLLALQTRDLELDKLKAELAAIPAAIVAVERQIAQAKQALEDSKKELTQLQMDRKNKEVDLESKEAALRKHTTELNTVNSNEAYKALLSEIDRAKQEKSVLEDGILQVMDQVDAATKAWKDRETAFKTDEGKFHQQSAAHKARQKELEQQISQKQAERQETAAQVGKSTEAYERIRKARPGAAIVPIRSEQCTGCHLKVSQNMINELRRGKTLTCESCSRIVYLEEAPTPAA